MYDLYSFDTPTYDSDTTQVGTLELQNVEQLMYEGRENVLRQRRYRVLDSLQNTEDSLLINSAYYSFQENLAYQIFAEDFYDIFDTMMPTHMLDTVVARDPEGPDFQYFYDYSPRWITVARFDAGASTSYEIFEEQRFYVDFQYRGHHITGHVDVRGTGLFWGFETLSTAYADSIHTMVIKNSTHFNFELQRDSVEVNDETQVIDIYTWYHEEAGIIKRVRTPFEFKVPTIPARYPALYYPGEIWMLRDIVGYEL